jgi:hypothetical protein
LKHAKNELTQLRDDLHKIIVGDLLWHNKNLVVHDTSRAGDTVIFLAHETTMDGVIETIAYAIGRSEYSLDLKMITGMMATIEVRVYAPEVSLEGLV